MSGTHASRVIALLALAALAGPAAAERGTFDQLPAQWQGLFPGVGEVVGLDAFPVIEAPADGRPVPFAVPGTPGGGMAPEVDYESADGVIEGVRTAYRLMERSTWTADGRELELWSAVFEVGVIGYASADELAANFARWFDPAQDVAVDLGDQAFFSHLVEDYDAQLEVRAGRHEIALRFRVEPGIFREVAREPLERVAVQWAGLIVERIAAGPPPVVEPVPVVPPATGAGIAVTAMAPGFAALTQRLAVPADRTPGEITVRVVVRTVVDGVATPAAGASVMLPDYGVMATTSAEGTAVLRAQGAGQDPVIGMMGFDLQPATGTGGEGDDGGKDGAQTGDANGEPGPEPTADLEPFEPIPLATDGTVKQAVICQGFDEQSNLVGCLDVFPAGTEKVALYLEMVAAGPNVEVEVTWYLERRIMGRQLLLVGGARRTVSYLYAHGRETLWPGAYAAEIREGERIVGRLTFRVEGEDA